MQKKDGISMDRKQIHELVNHSLNELQTRADKAGRADPHFPSCMAGFLTVLCVWLFYFILITPLHRKHL